MEGCINQNVSQDVKILKVSTNASQLRNTSMLTIKFSDGILGISSIIKIDESITRGSSSNPHAAKKNSNLKRIQVPIMSLNIIFTWQTQTGMLNK